MISTPGGIDNVNGEHFSWPTKSITPTHTKRNHPDMFEIFSTFFLGGVTLKFFICTQLLRTTTRAQAIALAVSHTEKHVLN